MHVEFKTQLDPHDHYGECGRMRNVVVTRVHGVANMTLWKFSSFQGRCPFFNALASIFLKSCKQLPHLPPLVSAISISHFPDWGAVLIYIYIYFLGAARYRPAPRFRVKGRGVGLSLQKAPGLQ